MLLCCRLAWSWDPLRPLWLGLLRPSPTKNFTLITPSCRDSENTPELSHNQPFYCFISGVLTVHSKASLLASPPVTSSFCDQNSQLVHDCGLYSCYPLSSKVSCSNLHMRMAIARRPWNHIYLHTQAVPFCRAEMRAGTFSQHSTRLFPPISTLWQTCQRKSCGKDGELVSDATF